MKTLKYLVLALFIGSFLTVIGCHAEADVDHPHDSSSIGQVMVR